MPRHELGVAVAPRRVLTVLTAGDVHDLPRDVGGVVTHEPRDDSGDVHGIEVEPGRWRRLLEHRFVHAGARAR